MKQIKVNLLPYAFRRMTFRQMLAFHVVNLVAVIDVTVFLVAVKCQPIPELAKDVAMLFLPAMNAGGGFIAVCSFYFGNSQKDSTQKEQDADITTKASEEIK